MYKNNGSPKCMCEQTFFKKDGECQFCANDMYEVVTDGSCKSKCTGG